ncbi:MAG: cytochrome c peroxidase [Sandaracinus sp.]
MIARGSSSSRLSSALVRSLAVLGVVSHTSGCAPPPPDGVSQELWDLCRDDLPLNARDCQTVARFRLPEALPVARGNRYADDERAARLGRAIFYDEGFANVPDVSCARCHAPERAFTDGMAVSEVIAGMPGARNSPSLLVSGRLSGFFLWDGRADSLWSQPLGALENPIEMGTTRLEIAHRVADVPTYREPYEAIFGALPSLEDEARFPPVGMPGQPSWEGMSEPDRDAVNRVVANVGKALEAYMRRIVSGPSALDRYLDGDRDAMSPDARRGLARFVETGCTGCHVGPMLTDQSFHAGREMHDRGRAQGIETLLASPFNAAGPYFDADAGEALELPLGPEASDEHAFRTPSLRNVTLTAPYEHDGSRTLAQILEARSLLYREGDERVIGAFFEALVGEAPPAEWASAP